jgi:hypothetical protein
MPSIMFGIIIQLGWLCRRTVFGITSQLRWLCRWVSSAYPFNLDGYAVDSLRHNHSTWMVTPLTVFGSGGTSAIIGGGGGGANIHTFVFTDQKNNGFQKKLIMQNTNIWIFAPPPQLSSRRATGLRHNHATWMVMPLTVSGITIQLGCLCRWICSA